MPRKLILLASLAPAYLACAHAPAPAPAAQAAAPTVPPAPSTPDLIEPMAKLAFMHGVWAGSAEGTDDQGKPYKVTQTERIGTSLGGDIVVIEGRGYKDDRTTAFNAFAVVSWNRQASKYEFRAYADGLAGTFDFTLTKDGYTWEVPAGPDTVMRFTASVNGKYWYEVGERVAAGKPPVKTFEMKLLRLEPTTSWPSSPALPPDLAPRQ